MTGFFISIFIGSVASVLILIRFASRGGNTVRPMLTGFFLLMLLFSTIAYNVIDWTTASSEKVSEGFSTDVSDIISGSTAIDPDNPLLAYDDTAKAIVESERSLNHLAGQFFSILLAIAGFIGAVLLLVHYSGRRSRPVRRRF